MGCGQSDPAAPAYSTTAPTATDEALAARGTIISSTTEAGFDADAFPVGTSAVAYVYKSVSGVTGESTQVSGALFVPAGEAPAGGRPVVAYAHGTVGIEPGCAPTETSALAGDAGAVSLLLEQGYAVTYTDYQGLSSRTSSPPHPYLEPRTAGFDVIDSVRAARNLDPTLSTRWLAAGSSQGGHAAWAANEFSDIYGDGLDLVGSAVLAPALDISPVVARAQTSTLSDGQRALYPMIVEGAAAVDSTIDPDEHLHGILGDEKSALISCGPGSAAARSAAAAQVQPGDTVASNTEAAQQLTSRLQEYSLPKSSSPAPILALYGGSDDIVLPAWTEVALGRACGFGDSVLRVRLEGQGHTITPGSFLQTWIADRFAGRPAPDNC
ncbi:Secretory lipase [Rhodococcoides kyotonense]|uniref:Secretory lipase n=1 Tax=Rhodococcoides kyotonense TaxID=398843 RepID=A0A239M9M7_9NOCA|nr:Secretory lipase [Rhodococcus kyotonensis]